MIGMVGSECDWGRGKEGSCPECGGGGPLSYEISLKEEIVMTVVVKGNDKGLGEALAARLKDLAARATGEVKEEEGLEIVQTLRCRPLYGAKTEGKPESNDASPKEEGPRSGTPPIAEVTASSEEKTDVVPCPEQWRDEDTDAVPEIDDYPESETEGSYPELEPREGEDRRKDYPDEGEDEEDDSEEYEDCEDFGSPREDDEVSTDFGRGFFGDGEPLQTIEEEEEEGEEEEEEEKVGEEEEEEEEEEGDDGEEEIPPEAGEEDSDTEKSELEQFEQLEQLCSSDDFDPEGLLDPPPPVRPPLPEMSEKKEGSPKVQSYHEYKKYREATRSGGGYRKQLSGEAAGGARSIGAGLRGGPVDRGIFGAPGFDFGADRWFAAQGTMRTREEAPRSAIRDPRAKRKTNKVQFDESLNKFFEADYVILIREEGECEGEGCDCGEFCYEDDDYEEDREEDGEEDGEEGPPEPPGGIAVDPPVEFVDTLTLSPPDGYKDLALQEEEERWPTVGDEDKELPRTEDHTTQTTPTSDAEPSPPGVEPEENHNSKSEGGEERYIVETITMTTVTERRIVEGDRRAEELTLRFRLGAGNSLKPNSAVRQLFPRFVSPPPQAKSPESDEEEPLQGGLIKRTIERNTLRRSLVRYPADIRLRKTQNKNKNDNSLVERIKQLTCDVDDDAPPQPAQPPPDESKDKVPAYKKITELFVRKDKELERPASVEHQYPYYRPPDLGNGGEKTPPRRPFLAPLTACVTGDPRAPSAASTTDSEYSLNDIEEALTNETKPDVVAGAERELAVFCERGAGRLARLRARYQEDDYGFCRRPSVRGIRPRFGPTSLILQQMQATHWPYYPAPPPRSQATQTPVPPPIYYPRSPCGSPTKMRLERGTPEGASAPGNHEHPPPATMMYAMNV